MATAMKLKGKSVMKHGFSLNVVCNWRKRSTVGWYSSIVSYFFHSLLTESFVRLMAIIVLSELNEAFEWVCLPFTNSKLNWILFSGPTTIDERREHREKSDIQSTEGNHHFCYQSMKMKFGQKIGAQFIEKQVYNAEIVCSKNDVQSHSSAD